MPRAGSLSATWVRFRTCTSRYSTCLPRPSSPRSTSRFRRLHSARRGIRETSSLTQTAGASETSLAFSTRRLSFRPQALLRHRRSFSTTQPAIRPLVPYRFITWEFGSRIRPRQATLVARTRALRLTAITKPAFRCSIPAISRMATDHCSIFSSRYLTSGEKIQLAGWEYSQTHSAFQNERKAANWEDHFITL